MEYTALIMAGGKGERFWPSSRRQLPKQFLSLTNSEKTMIQLTVERISRIVNKENIFIVTDDSYKELVKTQLRDIPNENILCEPFGKNTAPCIGLGAIHIKRKWKDAVMIVLPADHLVRDEDEFERVLKLSAQVAERKGEMITIGIQPNYPETGYGYIQYDKESLRNSFYYVKRFVEKPNQETAQKYLEEGDFFWNSGMFIWRVSSILKEMKQYIPELYEGLLCLENTIGMDNYMEQLFKEYNKFPSISIDFGVMEKCSRLLVYRGIFGWDDVGSWLSLERIHEPDKQGNVIHGNVVSYHIQNCIVEGKDRLIAIVGLENVIVVDSADITLVCSKDSTAEVKNLVQQLHCNGLEKYL